ncbi:MAG: hypothetical protein HY823_06815 [Acidobacteria bacterium]|nr:hypothetical protein [Acidobacteriota bacterium]
MPSTDLLLVLAAAGCWIIAAGAGALARTSERTFLGLGLAAALLAAGGAAHALWTGHLSGLAFRFWGLTAWAEMDSLSALFLVPLQVLGALGLVYGSAYWPLPVGKGRGVPLRCCYALLVAGLTLVFVLRQGLLFLVAWELMAVSAFFLISTEHDKPEAAKAGWVYLAATHVGTAALVAMAILLARRVGGPLWVPAQGPASGLDLAILALAVVGFGFKAGLLPLHFWLPAAHAGAPSHVSALLSGVMLKAGIYGILRVSSLLPPVPHAGALLLALGAFTALYGAAYALAQADYKRLMAYSSIENLGIIAMGIGLGMAGRAVGDPALAALGFAGALFHMLNHAAFKGLLFLGSGALLHATGTRRIDELGGLAKLMPRTALAMLPGVLTVSALPPFAAFASEWFLYRGLFAGLLRGNPWSASLALPALALTGGLAAVAFGKFYGAVFLGEARGPAGAGAHDPPTPMTWPLAILGVLCLALGLAAVPLLPLLERALSPLLPGTPIPLSTLLSGDLRLFLVLQLLLIAAGVPLVAWVRRGFAEKTSVPPTWDCGYAAPTARMQYTGGSFADLWSALLPGIRARVRTPRALFPPPTGFHPTQRDPLGLDALEPRLAQLADRLLRFRRLQQGNLSVYLLYVLIALLGVFLWMLVRAWMRG